MTFSFIAAFWVVSTLCALTPGVDWAYAISAGMHGRAVVPAVSGILFGQLVVAFIVAAGVGAVVASNPLSLTLLTFAGAAYLLWTGIGILRYPSAPSKGAVAASHSRTRWAVKGACVSGLNPKVFLLFLALLPQFIDRTASWSIPAQIIVLALIHITISGVVYLLVGFSAQAVLQTRPRAAQIVSRLSGSVMIVIAVFLLTEQAFR